MVDVHAFVEADVVKLAQVVCGDVIALGTALVQGAGLVASWAERRQNRRAASDDAGAAAKTVLAGIHGVKADAVPPPAQRHLLLILRSFGEAWARCLLSSAERKLPDKGDVTKKFAATLTKHWSRAFGAPSTTVSAQEQFVARITGDPLRTPHYQALWATLTDPSWGDAPLLPTGQKAAFEQYFRLAYSTALASPEGQEVRRFLDALGDARVRSIRRLLVQDLAGWGARHVFGNVAFHENSDLPDLPLQGLYVEPHGTCESANQKGPLLKLLRGLLSNHRIVVVSADMGLGKSLTARMLATEWATSFVTHADPSTEVELPLFLRCADVLDPALVGDLKRVTRLAQHQHCRQLGLELAEDDAACAEPDRSQRTLHILDGLDEVVLGEEQTRRLFEHLEHCTSDRHRVLVLSRPQVLPQDLLEKRQIPVVRVSPFSTHVNDNQAATWLGYWNERVRTPQDLPPISWADVEQRQLTDLAATPILLFMIAYTWDQFPGGQIKRAALYELFFRQIARGKHERDQGSEHKSIREAGKHLLEQLTDRGVLPSGGPDDVDEADGMLWLMGRIAWHAGCLEQRGDSLHRRHVERLVEDELELRDAAGVTARTIGLGVMLALQADPVADDQAILFGHKSFREYLIARYWVQLLGRIVNASQSEAAQLIIPLLAGRLLNQEDRSLDFLIEIIHCELPIHRSAQPHGWTLEQRQLLIKWTNEKFVDESQEFPDKQELKHAANKKHPSSLRNDRRAYLREAVLAIGSLSAAESKLRGLVVQDANTLRTLCAWLFCMDLELFVRAPGLVHQGANLSLCILHNADLSGSDLAGAQFMEATLYSANLAGAKLNYADLSGAKLQRANLEESKLCGANLLAANLVDTNLAGADLESAELGGANIDGAHLNGAKLTRANLRHCRLRHADLSGASLDGADLNRATLVGANLTNVKWVGTDGVPAQYTSSTQWPEGFDPVAAGLLLIENRLKPAPE